jgi:hypothetical protein
MTPLLVDGSGATQPVSGTVTANAGTNLNTSALALSATQTDRSQKSQITDGTRDGTVKAASTAAVAGDTSVVVALSPNSPLPTGSAIIGALTANQSVNLAQVAGSAVPTGNGTAATAQRVVIASDNSAVSVTTTRPPTYSASATGLVAAASATDIFTLTGSGTKTIRIKRVSFSGTQTTANDLNALLIKRSTANTAGTSTDLTEVANDSNDAAATATALSYTANPTLGTTVGTVRAAKFQLSGDAPANNGQYAPYEKVWRFGEDGQEEIVLRGTSQVLALNLNAVTIAGSSLNIDIEWVEE